MRKWIDLVESRTARATGGQFGSRKELLNAIFQHIRQQVDSRHTKYEFMDVYRDVMANLKFPLTVYRGLHWEDADASFDALEDDWDELGQHWDEDKRAEKARIADAIHKIDWQNVGQCWTWDRDSATSGGVIAGGGFNSEGSHVILTAVVQSRQVDLPTTLYHNLTVYQEEKEVRLLPNLPITITDIYPNPGIRLPIRANTGPPYDQYGILDDLVTARNNARKP